MPFGGLLTAGAASLLPAILKARKSRQQAQQARDLKQVDVTPEGVRQNLAAAQLAANSNRMPGQDAAESQINQSTAAAVNAARQGATGAGGLLATLGRGNTQRLGALSNLNARVQAYQDQARGRLASANNVQAGYDDKSRSEFTNARTSLDQASSENAMGALTDVANTGAFVGGHLLESGTGTTDSLSTSGKAVSYPGQTLGQRLLLRNKMRRAPLASDYYRNVA